MVRLPLAGPILGLAVRLSGDPALTDQQIAGFLLSPLGALVAVMVAAVPIVAAVLDLAFMATTLQQSVAGV